MLSGAYRAKILLVDDELPNLQAIQSVLEQEAYQVVCAERPSLALQLLNKSLPDLVITDLRMPEMNGIALLTAIRKAHPNCPVLLLSAFGSIDDAVEAMKLGAVDFISKPIRRSALLRVVEDALVKKKHISVSITAEKELLGTSASINELKRTVHVIAPSEAPVLINGESGTGKELVARAIHAASNRTGKLVAINCGAIPEPLLESELFGYARGAFTGAGSDKVGLFEEAHQGTLFLDEIAEMPIGLQVKLLRVLQDRVVRRVGSTVDKSVNFRVIAATNANLAEKITNGSFREDLFYRLNVINLTLSALRERDGDAVILAQSFLEDACRRYSKPSLYLADATRQAIAKHTWPGNVRELKNAIERAVVLAGQEELSPVDLGLQSKPNTLESIAVAVPTTEAPKISFAVGTSLADIELEVIRKTLLHFDGDKKKTAQALGVNLRTIYRKLDLKEL